MKGSGKRPGKFLDWKAGLGILLGVGLFIFALRDVSFDEVLGQIRSADPLLFSLSLVAATATILVRAWRWRVLLEPIRPGTAFRSRFQSSMIGFMANNILPARVGEVARAYTLSRMEPVPAVASVGSLVVERLLDGATVISFFFLSMALPSFPGVGDGSHFGKAAIGALVLLGGVSIVAIGLVLRPAEVIALAEWLAAYLLPERMRRPVVDGLRAFVAGLGALRQPRLLVQAAFWSLGVWLVNTLAFWLGFRAFGIDVPFEAAMFLQSLIAIAVALPSAPGFFGLWEAAAKIGLVQVWGVEVGKALGFAVGFHIGSFIPVTLLGLYYAWRLGLSVGDVGRNDEADAVVAGGSDAAALPEPPRP
jgi:uncharacterized protein (TIRG00374 family)